MLGSSVIVVSESVTDELSGTIFFFFGLLADFYQELAREQGVIEY